MATDMSGADCFENRDFSTAYTTLKLFPTGPMTGQSADITVGAYGARFDLDCDLSPLFPYINAVADHSQYYEIPVYIKFVLLHRLCAFYPRQGAFAPIRDVAEAMVFLPKLLEFIVDLSSRRSDIIPSQKKFKPVSILDIYRLLPGSNCRICGYATCMAFAAALSRQRTSMVDCPHLARPVEEKAIFPVYDQQGNVVRTVSLDIDTACLRQQIDQKETHIQSLQSRLSDLERIHAANFDAANKDLPMPLTRREIQVLQWMAGGATNKEISRELQISQHTVKSHVIHIFNKIGVNDRAQASAWGALHGLRVCEHP